MSEIKPLSNHDILKVFYILKDKDKYFPMIEREISSALGSQLFVYGWKKAVEFDIQSKAEVAELRAALEGQTQRANALALVINDLTKMVTHDAETKQQFIERVKSILSVDPDLRVSKFESALQAGNAEQARRIAEVKEVIDQSNALDKYEIIERISGVLSAQKGTE